MQEVLEQLRADLLSALYLYQQHYQYHAIPEIRYQDIGRLSALFQEKANQDYKKFIKTARQAVTNTRTIWWPFQNQTSLHKSLNFILDDYGHPEVERYINEIEALDRASAPDPLMLPNESFAALTEWSTRVASKAYYIEKLKGVLLNLRASRASKS